MSRSLVHLVPFAAICASCSLVVDLSSLGSDAGDDASGVDAPSGDAIPDISVDLACTAPPPVVADDQAVFVSGKLGADGALCGTRAAPCATLASGLTHAVAEGLHVVYLDDSTFTESVAIGASFSGGTIQGGWHIANGEWSPLCGTATKIAAPDDAGSAIDIESSSDVVLRYLSVFSKPSGGFGESVYATRVLDTPNVTLDHVVLVAQNGGVGLPGVNGAPQSGCTTSAPGSGTDGSGGDAGAVGTFGPQGYVSVAASSGTNGNTGTLTSPTGGQCASCATCVLDAGGLDGGFEGGGCSTSFQSTCAGGGATGCAGFGGGAGGGGSGGGAAIALYAWGATTTVTIDGAFVVGNGGAGGAGGPGASGSPGTTGSSGKTAMCGLACSAQCTPTGLVVLDAGAGGTGSSGGTGGQGGGGAGGPIYFYAAMNGALVSPSTTTPAASQFIGGPGQGGLPNGAAGAKAVHP